MSSSISFRRAVSSDESAIFQLYKNVARLPGGIAREEDEVDPGYITHFMQQSLNRGLEVVAVTESGRIVGEIHAYPPGIKVFAHAFSDLTIVVDPEFQGKGIGRNMFREFLRIVETEFPDILRVELVVRESNEHALRLYESLGFKVEGNFEYRIKSVDEGYESDVPMGWIRGR